MASIHLHREKCGTWVCPACALALGAALVLKLKAAAVVLESLGYKFILVTLTVRRDGAFGTAAEAFAASRRERWVAECMRRWARVRGLDRVHYLTKLELQDAGWPHWHVLVVVPVKFKIRLPWRGRPGEFDEVWTFGFSNVQRDGDFTSYQSKMASYAAKSAVKCEGGDGLEAVRASGLPTKGVHWLQPSHGFWEFCGISPLSESDAKRWADDAVAADDGTAWADGRAVSVVGVPRAEPASLADRVAACGWTTVLTVEGGMRDESGALATRSGRFGIRLPLRRSLVGQALEEYFGAESVTCFDDSPIVESVPNISNGSVLGFLESLFPFWSGVVEILDEVALRLGYDVPPGVDDVGPRWPLLVGVSALSTQHPP